RVEHLLDAFTEWHRTGLLHTGPLLQRNEAHARQTGEGCERRERDRAASIVNERWAALPRDADLEARPEPCRPGCHALRIGDEIRDVGRYALRRDAEHAGHADQHLPAQRTKRREFVTIRYDALESGNAREH